MQNGGNQQPTTCGMYAVTDCTNETILFSIWSLHTMDTIINALLDRDSWPQWQWEICGSNRQPKHATKPSELCCHLVKANKELSGLARAIPPATKLILSLLFRQQFLHFKIIHIKQSHSVLTQCTQNMENVQKSMKSVASIPKLGGCSLRPVKK